MSELPESLRARMRKQNVEPTIDVVRGFLGQLAQMPRDVLDEAG